MTAELAQRLQAALAGSQAALKQAALTPAAPEPAPVSYTHLTLPTILRV